MSQADRSVQVAEALPYLRRYARALTGSQQTGDNYAAATLEAILADRSALDAGDSVKVALFSTFHGIWISTGAPITEEDAGPRATAQRRLSTLTAGSREALLLHTVEEFTVSEVAQVMNVDPDEAARLIEIARSEMSDAMSGRVLIIEDEAIIAMDLETIVADLGHKVTGVARTRDAAVELAGTEVPDLVMADIHLADDSSGIDAVNDILRDHGDRPVIFITAYPERLLTGERPEPAFLISKPYSEEQVRSAISQAMFFSSTETLKV
ncbi:response regulator [Allosediminivita pacifica]|uniref:Response regulator receiver protein n=1 Tax=Allosediminivita pacifica TaxID=1267769 RepID=A0A2T6AV42_9RHOB|nr:response regulator [Allosediminivita pacifica]PTX47679.1 response regulator receiver protein [Allosediminivita pacifica]GGB13675.1 two-component response regulator [Allosediminivita pacifica]